MAPVELVEASLRHGQQSLLLSRLRQRDAVEVAALLDRCGFAALEVFGGTTFEASLRFLAEQPFERLRAIREAAPSTPLMGTIAGRALVGHAPVQDDVIDAFVRVTAEAGIDIFRCYDPLNDVRNVERCLAAVRAVGRRSEGVLCYTDASVDGLVEVAARLVAAGADSLCLHDPLGLPGMARAGEIVRRIVAAVDVPVAVSFAAQTSQASLAYASAVTSGARRLDVALAPLASGASYPSAESIIAATDGTDLRTGLDVRQVAAAGDALEESLTRYQEIADPAAMRIDSSALRGLLPVSAMPHAIDELRRRQSLDRFDEVEQEITRVRTELGYPPLVPPISEIIATQAVYNVCDGDRYATLSQEVSDYCLGLYGVPPEPIDPLVRDRVAGRASAPLPSLQEARRELAEAGFADAGEDAVVCQALFPADHLALLRGQAHVEPLPGDEAIAPVEPLPPASPGSRAPVSAAGEGRRTFTVEVDGETYEVRISGDAIPSPANGEETAGPETEGALTAPMPGLVVRVVVAEGDHVDRGDVVVIIEAMKMQNEIAAPAAGRVGAVFVTEGASVVVGTPLVRID